MKIHLSTQRQILSDPAGFAEGVNDFLVKEASACYSIHYQEHTLIKPEIVANLCYPRFNCRQESMYLFGLSVKNDIRLDKLVSRGSHNQLSSVPGDILTPLLKNNCCHFIVAHNHPSGDTSPSEEDMAFTRKLQQGAQLLGLTLLDHVIFCKDTFYSFKKESLL